MVGAPVRKLRDSGRHCYICRVGRRTPIGESDHVAQGRVHDRRPAEARTETASAGSAISFARYFMRRRIPGEGHDRRLLDAGIFDAAKEGHRAIAGNIGAAEIQSFKM